MNPEDIVIVAAKRTPMGSLLGQFAHLTAPDLGAIAHRAALQQAKLAPELLDEVLMGCVLQAGIGQAPARQSAIKAQIPDAVGATTINKMCGSGMKAVMMAADALHADSVQVMLAGGMENMSQAPYLLKKARTGYRLGHHTLIDHVFLDGLEDAYEPGKLMGVFADETAQHYGITRTQQDEFAIQSMQRALAAQKQDHFKQEITAVETNTGLITQDEGPSAAKLEKVLRLKPAFSPNGTVTPANSSSITDGAASLILMKAKTAQHHGIKPLARIVAYASHAEAPAWFTIAPVGAIKKVLQKAQWDIHDVDLFEINEAFAVVTLAAIQQLALDQNKVNIHGGACALGHPIGASGARILVTLIYALLQNHKKRGIASLCIGGGEATALALEVI